MGEKITGLGVLDLARGALRFDLVCPDGMSRHSALDHPVYPKHVEARSEEVRVTRGGRTARVFTIRVLLRRAVG